jgi:hypothetical protein
VPFDSLEVLTRELVRKEETAHRITALTNQTKPINQSAPSSSLPTPPEKNKENEKANTHQISPMRIHLTSIIPRQNINLGLIDEPHHLDIIRRLHILHTRKRASGYKPRSMTRLGAPCDHRSFDIADFATVFCGCPEAEICVM